MIGKTVFFCPHESDKEAYAYGKELIATVVGTAEYGFNLQVLRNGPGNPMFRGDILKGDTVAPEGHVSKSRFYIKSQVSRFAKEAKAEEVLVEESPVMKRARDKDGRYKGDDPSTPDVNEAYTEVAEPAKKRSFKKILTGKPSK